MANEIVVSGNAEMFMPVMEVRQAVMRRDAVVCFVRGMMTEGTDFGKVPGTDKNTLLKPGAEKLTTFFGLAPMFVPERIVEEFGDDGREPLFFYRYRCELYRMGVLVGSGIGSCNSRESKYRYRNGQRLCPECQKAAIARSKYPPRNQPDADPGWYCNAKAGGCGAQFDATDRRITEQVVGKVPNPDVADLVNTIDKMAQKRALIAAVLIAVNASEFFTQDVEDMVIDAEYTVAQPRKEAQPQSAPPAASSTTTNGGGAGNGNGHANGKASGVDAFKRYQAAKEAARKSGKFSGDKHLDQAWSKKFAEFKAGDPTNADAFLTAWALYVEEHEPAKDRKPADVPAMADVPEMAGGEAVVA